MSAAGTGARRARWTAASALAAALFIASQTLLWLAYYGGGAKRLIGDEESYQAFALAILGGGPWMPSTIWPPLQSLLLAAIYATFGVHVAAAQLVQTLLFVGCAVLLRAIWRDLGGSVRAANTAAVLFLVHPANAAYAHWLWPEVPHLFLVLLAFRLLLAWPRSRVAAAAAGAATGFALLAKSLLAAFWPVFLLAFVQRERPRFLVAPAAAFLVTLALVTAPALWHGWREYGQPMIADSSSYNLWIGLTDRWRSDYVEDMGGVTLPAFLASGDTPQQRNAIYRGKALAFVRERGVATVLADQVGRQYFRLFSAKTPLVSQLPGPSCAGHLSVYATPTWLTRTLTLWNDAFHALILAAAAFGIACWRRRLNRPNMALVLIGLYAAYQLALMLLIHVKARFLFPLTPFLCGFAGSFLAASLDRWTAPAHPSADRTDALALTPIRLAIGAALAALLLFLAFAGPTLDHLCAG
jgi:4-amino-4-deoxy-L-arabinose transferase-like glycosyltransferase